MTCPRALYMIGAVDEATAKASRDSIKTCFRPNPEAEPEP
jgi:hypothetical protein